MSKKLIADIYPLSPMQEGMLYHYLADQTSEEYFEQNAFILKGTLDVALFAEAWNLMVEKMDVLRTVIRWENVEKPVQVVLNSRQIKIREADLTHLAPESWEEGIRQFLAEDRKEAFDLSKGPLIRIWLCHLDSDHMALSVGFHHIIMDGWSTAILWKDLFQLYRTLQAGQIPMFGDKPRFRDYIKFLSEQDSKTAGNFWRNYLANFTVPTGVPMDFPERGAAVRSGDVDVLISAEKVQRLSELARSQKVTLNIVMQVALGILLQRYNDTDDVVFGATVSGRPPELAGIQESVGLYINTIPVRMRAFEDQTVIELLRMLQDDSLERSRFEYTSLVEIKKMSELKGPTRLFQNIIVFENYPVDEELNALDLGVEVLKSIYHTRTNYELIFSAMLRTEGMVLNFSYNAELYTELSVQQIAAHYQLVLDGMLRAPEAQIGEIQLPADEVALRRQGLRYMEAEIYAYEEAAEYVAPRNALEESIAAVWCEILELERVGVHDSFFAVGGNSLMIIRLFEKLKQVVAEPITVANLFSYHTIAMLSEYVDSLRAPEISVTVAAEEMSAGDHIDSLMQQLANGELSPEMAAELLTGGRLG